MRITAPNPVVTLSPYRVSESAHLSANQCVHSASRAISLSTLKIGTIGLEHPSTSLVSSLVQQLLLLVLIDPIDILCQWTAVGWKHFKPHIWVSCVVVTWLSISSLQAAVQNYAGLVVLRVLLGVSEAMYAGVPLYLSFFYPRDRLGFRQAIFASAGSMANEYGSALGYAILQIKSHIEPWRILFLIEGLPGLLLVVAAFFFFPDDIKSTKFLSEREKEVAIAMVSRGQIADIEDHQGTRWKQFMLAFSDWRSKFARLNNIQMELVVLTGLEQATQLA